jgi:4-hydroxy-4-methyl-2-oxoglutarate aldolase
MRGTIKFYAPPVGQPIVIANALVSPGDLIVADADGVLSLPASEVARTLVAARKRTDKETVTMKRLQAGETTLELLGLTAHRRQKKP